MSTRATRWIWGPVHVFYDVVADATFVDVGRDSYNLAVEVWPFTLRVLYGPRWVERLPWKHPQLRHELEAK